jgi:AcrR family transcriptional regulator
MAARAAGDRTSVGDVSTARQRMSRPDDARALRSRAALRRAFLALIEERPLEQISIRDITSHAGVSYPVFFRRYATKEELFEDIATEEVRQLLSLTMPIFDAQGESESLRVLCSYIDERRGLWRRLLTGGAAPAMHEEFKRIAKEIGGTRELSNPWLPRDLAASFVVSGLFEIFAWWLRQADDYPIENVVKIIDALIVRSTVRPVAV